jgi:hypothetical protein
MRLPRRWVTTKLLPFVNFNKRKLKTSRRILRKKTLMRLKRTTRSRLVSQAIKISLSSRPSRIPKKRTQSLKISR